jgi:preprotein translocase subunit SecD
MMLTHSTDKPAWGVKSVEMTSTTIYGPVVKRVQIDFDDTGRDLLRQFSEKYVRHSIAVVVDGQVIVSMGLLTPIRKGGLGLTFPEGAEAVAGKLRDSLTSEQK